MQLIQPLLGASTTRHNWFVKNKQSFRAAGAADLLVCQTTATPAAYFDPSFKTWTPVCLALFLPSSLVLVKLFPWPKEDLITVSLKVSVSFPQQPIWRYETDFWRTCLWGRSFGCDLVLAVHLDASRRPKCSSDLFVRSQQREDRSSNCSLILVCFFESVRSENASPFVQSVSADVSCFCLMVKNDLCLLVQVVVTEV